LEFVYLESNKIIELASFLFKMMCSTINVLERLSNDITYRFA